MSIIAERYALHYKTIGYHHYSREFEKKGIDQILKGELEQLSKLSVENLNVNTLADDPLRSLKNNMICMVTVIGRAVIDAGCDAEKSFAIGDSYIIRAERQTDIESVVTLGIEMVQHYSKLVREERLKNYSLPVMRAIRYIHNHIYETCTIKELAEHLGLHANYLSALFRKEVGITPTAYIKHLRLEEAKQLLTNGEDSVTEIAEMLGYSSVSYFSKDFKQFTGRSPKKWQ